MNTQPSQVAVRIKICLVYSKTIFIISCMFCKTQCQHLAESWVCRDHICPLYSMCSTNDHCHYCYKNEKMRHVSKQHILKAFECPVTILSASALFCQGCLLTIYSVKMENFGGSLINVFSLSNLFGRNMPTVIVECPQSCSPVGTVGLSCSSLPGSTVKCLAYLNSWNS